MNKKIGKLIVTMFGIGLLKYFPGTFASFVTATIYCFFYSIYLFQKCLVGLNGCTTTLELKEGPGFLKDSSEEYWTMSESLIQQYHVGEEGNFIVKPFQ